MVNRCDKSASRLQIMCRLDHVQVRIHHDVFLSCANQITISPGPMRILQLMDPEKLARDCYVERIP